MTPGLLRFPTRVARVPPCSLSQTGNFANESVRRFFASAIVSSMLFLPVMKLANMSVMWWLFRASYAACDDGPG